MYDRIGQKAGSCVAILLAMSCVFIGKVVAVDASHSPLGVVLAYVNEPTADEGASGVAGDGGAKVAQSPADAPALTQSTEVPSAASSQPEIAAVRSLHRLVLESDGSISGTLRVATYGGSRDDVTAAEATSVKLLAHCTIAHQAETDAAGYFRLENVREGLYTLVADGPSGLMVMRVSVEYDPTQPATPLNALLVPNVDAQYVRTMIQQQLPSEQTLPSFLAFENVEAPDAPIDTPLVEAVSSTQSLTSPYGLGGRLLRLNVASGLPVPVSEASAELVRNGRGVTPLAIESDGRCAADALEAAHYSLVAYGPEGICAVGVAAGDLTSPTGFGHESAIDPCFVEIAVAPLDACSEIVDAELIHQPPLEFIDEYPCGDVCGFGGGCFGGGGGGFAGGGGYHGGGGLGALLGLAGLAGLVALVDDDDDDRQLATPFRRSSFARVPLVGPAIF